MDATQLTVLGIEQASGLPGVLLWNVSKLWQRQVHAAVAPLGLSSTNATILVTILHLSLDGERISQAVVAGLSNVDIMTTSNALRTLEKKQFITRTMDTVDRRANALVLTPARHTAATEAVHSIAAAHQQFFDVIADDRAYFSELLSRLLQAHGPDKSVAINDKT